jgi:hypothetical protein
MSDVEYKVGVGNVVIRTDVHDNGDRNAFLEQEIELLSDSGNNAVFKLRMNPLTPTHLRELANKIDAVVAKKGLKL